MIPRPWLGRVPYAAMLARQRAHREAVLKGDAEEVMFLLEHPPVVTLGRRGGAVDRARLQARGVPVVDIERGGLATYHGPGQLVAYPILYLQRRGWGVRHVVRGMEEGVIRWLAGRGITAHRREGLPGVWVGTDKIASLGLHVRRGVTLHGLALNLDVPRQAWQGLVPCGVSEGGVTCVAERVGEAPTPAEAAESVGATVWAEIVRACG